MSNPFAGMNETSTSKGGQYLKPGNYELDVTKCIYLDNDDKRAFIAEMVVTESSNPAIQVGSARSWYQAQNKSFKAEVKGFCYALLGYDEKNAEDEKFIREFIDSRSEAIMLKALTHQWPAKANRRVAVECFDKPKKNTPGEMFTKHVFRPAKGLSKLTKEQIELIINAK